MNIKEIDKWLDNEYGVSYTRLEELHDFLIEQNMKYQDKIDDLQQENKQLKEELEVSQSNEETYELEMQEITKILGLDEDTLFDDVKDYAKQVKEQLENKIDLYEDTISYQLGFDKGKEKYYQALLDIKALIQHYGNEEKILDIVNEALGDKENEKTYLLRFI